MAIELLNTASIVSLAYFAVTVVVSYLLALLIGRKVALIDRLVLWWIVWDGLVHLTLVYDLCRSDWDYARSFYVLVVACMTLCAVTLLFMIVYTVALCPCVFSSQTVVSKWLNGLSLFFLTWDLPPVYSTLHVKQIEVSSEISVFPSGALFQIITCFY